MPCCGVRWLPYGPHGILIYFAEVADEEALRIGRAVVAALERHPPPGLREYVPAFTSVLLDFLPDQRIDAEAIITRLRLALSIRLPEPKPKRIPVVYDGEDLPLLADHAGMTVSEVIECHAAPTYRVAALGFAPGFPYLSGLDARLHWPRRATPRVRVPAGSVAIGGEHTGIYPFASPGGWHLLGRTEAVLFSPQALSDTEKFLLHPGDVVIFEPQTP